MSWQGHLFIWGWLAINFALGGLGLLLAPTPLGLGIVVIVAISCLAWIIMAIYILIDIAVSP